MPKTRLYLLLEEKVKAVVDANTDSLISGQARDFPTYRETVGYIRGLNDALTLCEQIEEDFSK